MIDFVINTLAEIADFFINFVADKIIDTFAKKKKIESHESNRIS